jgi:hypothetical protein
MPISIKWNLFLFVFSQIKINNSPYFTDIEQEQEFISAVQNQVDEIAALIAKTSYLLTLM